MSTAEPIVSVIVPVYNASRYLPKCIESLLGQTLHDAEFIFVDDGSSDSSSSILKQAAFDDCRVHVVEQGNLGAAVARNSGIELARGQYIIFLDADDWFDQDMLQSMSELLCESNAEVCEASFYLYDEKSGSNSRYEKPCGGLGPGIYNRDDIQPELFSHWGAPWNKMFKRRFITKNNIQFQNLPNTNDVYFVFRSLLSAEKVVITDKAFVHYRWRSGSSLQDGKVKHPLCSFQAVCALRDWSVESGYLNQDGKKSLDWMCFSLVVSGMKLSSISTGAAKTVFDSCKTAFQEWGIDSLPRNYFPGFYKNFLYSCVSNTTFDGLVKAFGIRGDSRYQTRIRKMCFALALIVCRVAWGKEVQGLKKIIVP